MATQACRKCRQCRPAWVNVTEMRPTHRAQGKSTSAWLYERIQCPAMHLPGFARLAKGKAPQHGPMSVSVCMCVLSLYAGLLAVGLRTRERIRDQLLASGAVWTAHEALARRLQTAGERESEQQRLDAMSGGWRGVYTHTHTHARAHMAHVSTVPCAYVSHGGVEPV